MLIIKSPWASKAGLKHPQNVLVAKATATSYAFRKHAFQGARRSVQVWVGHSSNTAKK